MKSILLALALLIALPLGATHKGKNTKHYIQDDEIFLYTHGIYVAYPQHLYRVKTLRFSKAKGYYTYKHDMQRISISQLPKWFYPPIPLKVCDGNK